MTDDQNLDIATRLVHSGERGGLPDGKPVANPIYASATFTYDSMEEVDQVFSGEKQGYIYSRYGNPTVAALAEAVRDLQSTTTPGLTWLDSPCKKVYEWTARIHLGRGARPRDRLRAFCPGSQSGASTQKFPAFQNRRRGPLSGARG